LECTNTLLSPDVPPATTLTCLSAIVWPEEARVTLANAGFAAPFHCQGNEVREVEATGLPLAVMLDARYTQTSLLMAPGERLVFYSPGLLAVRNARGESFDSARLRAILRRRTDEAQDLIASVLDELKTFTGRGVRPSDDFVIAVLERTDDGQQPSPPPDNGLAGRWTPVSQISGQGRLPE
jgi:serine phosphatase RsbU (regulator of sigma subunit)